MKVKIYVDKNCTEYDLDSYKKSVVSFGRSSECDIKISKEYVSRSHGCFLNKNGRWYIRDLNSKCGIYGSEGRIEEVLLSGETFRIFGKDKKESRIKIVAGQDQEANRNYGTNIAHINTHMVASDGYTVYDNGEGIDSSISASESESIRRRATPWLLTTLIILIFLIIVAIGGIFVVKYLEYNRSPKTSTESTEVITESSENSTESSGVGPTPSGVNSPADAGTGNGTD